MSQDSAVSRPWKFDDLRRAEYLDLLCSGVGRSDAARAVGVSRRTPHRLATADEDFRAEVERAEATARVRAVRVVADAAERGDWRAAAWYLERSDPQNWGRVQRVQSTGADRDGVVIDVTEVETRLSADVKARRERYEAEMAAAAEADDIPDAEIGDEPVPEVGPPAQPR